MTQIMLDAKPVIIAIDTARTAVIAVARNHCCRRPAPVVLVAVPDAVDGACPPASMCHRVTAGCYGSCVGREIDGSSTLSRIMWLPMSGGQSAISSFSRDMLFAKSARDASSKLG